MKLNNKTVFIANAHWVPFVCFCVDYVFFFIFKNKFVR